MSKPARTSSDSVKNILGSGDSGPLYNYDGTTELSPFIEIASSIVDQVATMSLTRGYTLTSDQLELIERWLAAHFYQVMDQGYQSKTSQGASGNFVGQTGMRLETTYYGQSAMLADVSGTLEILNKRKIAGLAWLGKPPSQQIPYNQRN